MIFSRRVSTLFFQYYTHRSSTQTVKSTHTIDLYVYSTTRVRVIMFYIYECIVLCLSLSRLENYLYCIMTIIIRYVKDNNDVK